MTVGDIEWNGVPARLVSLRDVTERQQARELRDRLAHIDRLAAIGQLAAGVTHEINNPATYVMANLTAMNDTLAALAQDLADRPELSARVEELCDMVQENIGGMGRIRSITRDLRTFARIDSNEVTLVDLNECVNAACKIAMSEIRPRAQLIQELGDLPPVPGSQGKLAQVITNLLVNAAQAIPEGQPDAHSIKVRTGATEGAVWCQVQDSGRGIAADVRAKIFDPFFTTKPIGQGMGMGLALCADIVRQHQGTIRALDNPAGGALFELRLPLESHLKPSAGRSGNAAPPSSASQVRARVVTGHPLRLLLIDDEPLVLRSLKRMLARHQVDVAAGGAEALAKLAANSDYDLIFCDLMMPGVDGAAVHAAMVERFPQLVERLVFCSGGAFTPRTKSFLEQSTQPLVEKPMTPESFSDIAQRVLSPSRLRLVSGGDA
jgi:nitrogen-specific signal transduction histidine kinase